MDLAESLFLLRYSATTLAEERAFPLGIPTLVGGLICVSRRKPATALTALVVVGAVITYAIWAPSGLVVILLSPFPLEDSNG
jgi:hypothetical protein